MRPPPASPVPVIVLTGFLGAGKTTLLNALLGLPALAGTAVIVNEFGDIGIDHLLVEAVDGDMLMLTTGCLCCMARGELVSALAGLFERRAAGQVGFDRIVIETTGLADPGPVLNALLPSSDVGTLCRFDRLVTLVDAVAGLDMIETSAEAARQVVFADLLVLSKTDLLSGDGGMVGIETRLHGLNPTAPIVTTRDPEAVLKAIGAPPIAGRERAGAHPHSHAHLHGIESVILQAGRIDPRRFETFLDLALARHGADLLRMKGLLADAAAPARPVLINIVQHRIHPAAILEAWPDEDRDTRLVVIAKGRAADEIANLWAAFFGPPAVDRPDADALSFGRDAGPGLF